jgi:hypothetical protein
VLAGLALSRETYYDVLHRTTTWSRVRYLAIPLLAGLSFLLGCPRKKRFVVTIDTLSPLTKCGAVDGSVRAYISSLCSYNTERTMACISCNNRNRSHASCETRIDGRMLNNMYGDSS